MNKYLKKLRHSLGFSQKEMALLIGVKTSSLSHYESGRRQISPKVAHKIIDLAKAQGLNVGLEHIYPRDY